MSEIASRAPRPASSSASARPIPEPAPVTTQTLPRNSFTTGHLSGILSATMKGPRMAVAVGASAGLAPQATAGASAARVEVSIGPPGVWLPIGGRPTTLTLLAKPPAAASRRALNAYVTLQSPERACAASASGDRVRPVHTIPALFAPARRD